MQEKLYKCNCCGKEFDELLPTQIAYIESIDDIPITKEVCPYCFSDDITVKCIMNPFILGIMAGLDVKKIINEAIDEMIAKGELELDEE